MERQKGRREIGRGLEGRKTLFSNSARCTTHHAYRYQVLLNVRRHLEASDVPHERGKLHDRDAARPLLVSRHKHLPSMLSRYTLDKTNLNYKPSQKDKKIMTCKPRSLAMLGGWEGLTCRSCVNSR